MSADQQPNPHWSRFTAVFAATAAILFLAAVGFLLAVDPYDSGRTRLLRREGVHDQYPTTAHASRARNPRFNAAIFGNSHMQQLRPERLDRLTGLSFVSLTMPGTNPADQLSVLGWFLASHRRDPPRAVVLGLDARWCWPTTELSARFPEWLYSESLLTYVVGLVRYRALEAAAARLSFLATGKGGARPDGYWDYVPVFAKLGLDDQQASRRMLEKATVPFKPNPDGTFPGLDRLRALMRRAPAETRFVLLRPPIFVAGFPREGSPEAHAMAACAAAVERVAAAKAGTVAIDLLKPGPMADDPANFYDYDHYRDPLAVEIERRIAAGLATS